MLRMHVRATLSFFTTNTATALEEKSFIAEGFVSFRYVDELISLSKSIGQERFSIKCDGTNSSKSKLLMRARIKLKRSHETMVSYFRFTRTAATAEKLRFVNNTQE